ncbi:MAG: hypothetical protein ABI723_12995 [Bacteroidia bacterium]
MRYVGFIQIPVPLIRYGINHNLVKELQLLAAFKFVGSGKIHKDSSEFKAAIELLGVKDKRTIEKRLLAIQNLGWVSLSSKSGYYFISGFEKLKKQYAFKGQKAAVCELGALKKFREFVDGALISENINGQKLYYNYLLPKQKRAAAINKGAARKLKSASLQVAPPYYGLSNKSISKLLKCCLSVACERKQAAANAGFIKTIKKRRVISYLYRPDYKIRMAFSGTESEAIIRFEVVKRKNKNLIMVFEQLHDEIVPLIHIRRCKRP